MIERPAFHSFSRHQSTYILQGQWPDVAFDLQPWNICKNRLSEVYAFLLSHDYQARWPL